MSTYQRLTKHPQTGKWEMATWFDDLFGHHNYGVVFPSDEKKNPGAMPARIAFDPRKITLQTK